MIRLFSIIALLVLSVSVSSAFVESAYADEHDDPIKTVLDITYQNILETRENIDDVPENANTLFSAGEDEYFEALSALEAGDTDAARDHALIAMALFEDSTEVIGEFEGFEDDDIDIPSEITGQFTFNNIFETQEQTSELESEFEELEVLAELNGFDIDFDALEDIDSVYDQLNQKAIEYQDDREEEFREELEDALEQDLDEDSINQINESLDALGTGDSEFAEETDEGAETETDEGAETETDEGAETETDEGAETETDEGAETETDEGAETETNH